MQGTFRRLTLPLGGGVEPPPGAVVVFEGEVVVEPPTLMLEDPELKYPSVATIW